MSETVFNDNGKWSKSNIYFEMAVMSKYKLGGFQLAILSYIVNSYNRAVLSYKPMKGCNVSYLELARRCNCPEVTAKKAIKVLLDEKLIEQTNRQERQGRKSYCYVPNVKKLNKITDEYLKDIPEDKHNENFP